ncbi:bifunctional 2-polyprenyl-6-hydroxyphenol methylase/3-demethylubiquinol 3-O-methyltransferase UbiG [Mesorhizobium sp. GbtcB19]|uniref:class I SAM-dependent methyltransferase n=1 Tax=Mesorhizobium sp. GbtcB19 TaxID=2824764 RepID=UPI001C308BD4|nr:class I SAM-dependent methyltransferase [Mesorhizobium sp. GbtcB19]
MRAGIVRSSELGDFVRECDNRGGPQHPNCVEFIRDFKLQFDTLVDQSIDPFSEAYVAQQVALYEELALRKLNQDDGEQAAVGIEERVNTPNPYGHAHTAFLAKHSRAVLSALMAANVPPAAKILDMGSGWGLSSEIMAFCGVEVTAVDINPDFIELNRRRAERLGLPIKAFHSTFDEFETAERFDAALFYECLHHAVRPWTAIKRVGSLLKPGGKVVFTGEPINDNWKNWGLRTDPLAVYCIHKFGWFESGWSMSFLHSAFDRAGFRLSIAQGVGTDNGPIGVAVRKDEADGHDFTIAAPYMTALSQLHEALGRRPSARRPTAVLAALRRIAVAPVSRFLRP